MNTMKNTILGLSLLLAAGTLSAGNVSNNFTGNDRIKKQIQKELSFPEFLKGKKEGAEVKVSFTVNKEGKAQIVSVNTEDAALRKYVEAKMKAMQFKQVNDENEIHNINLVFKRI
jgi:hypothetical protein